MSLLEISGLSAGYGKAVIIRGIDLTIDEGESVALVGRNGAGKTTLLHTLFGLTQIHGGSVTISGKRHDPSRGSRPAAQGLALTPQGRRILTELTVQDNLLLGTAAKRSGRWDLESVYALFPVLSERAGKPGSALSGGQQQMLAIGRSLMANPALLFLDEPSEGLAPVVIDELADVLKEIQQAGTAIFVVEQHLELIRRLTERVVVLSKGEITAQALTSELNSPEVQAGLTL